jgi:hypothetical protein
MSNDILKKILNKAGQRDLIEVLTNKLSFSELNTVLLEVFKAKTEKIKPSDFLYNYNTNRFVKPSNISPIELLELKVKILKIALTYNFTPIELSPVAVLGTCSAISKVNQNNIISALRGTEVLADATNSLALHICSLKKEKPNREHIYIGEDLKYCTLHRHIRAQKYNDPKSLPHFELFCLVTSGRDRGSYSFEKESIVDHINLYITLMNQITEVNNLKLQLIKTSGYTDTSGFTEGIKEHIINNLAKCISVSEKHIISEKQYYQGIQFKLYLNYNNVDLEICDGGFVDWAQSLLQNKKEKMLISGLGVERLLSLQKYFC